MRACIACAVALTGCGRFGFDALGPSDGSSVADVPFPTGAWGPPVEVTELTINGVNDDPVLTADQLEIYFNSASDIYFSTRDSIGDLWRTPQRENTVSSGMNENTPAISPDGLELYFSRANPTNGDVMVSTRATRADAWSTPVYVTELNTLESEAGMHVMPDRLKMYMATGSTANSVEVIVTSRAALTSPWAAPTLVPTLNSVSFDSDPFVTEDDLDVYWSSGRGTTAHNMWHATRENPVDSWTNLAPVTELNTAEEVDDPWLSPDRRTLYFSRGTATDLRIYRATR